MPRKFNRAWVMVVFRYYLISNIGEEFHSDSVLVNGMTMRIFRILKTGDIAHWKHIKHIKTQKVEKDVKKTTRGF